jgi:hypothetical protein
VTLVFKERVMRKIVLYFLFTISGCAVADMGPKGGICNSELPFVLKSHPNVAKVGKLRFSSEFGISRGYFKFTNSDPRQVASVFMRIELRDRLGQFMFVMPFHAFEAGTYKEGRSRYQGNVATQFDKSVMPGESRYWGAMSPFFSTACPDVAIATLIEIQYKDHSHVRYLAEGTHEGPTVLYGTFTDLNGAPFAPPYEAMTKIHVDSDGHGVVTDSGGNLVFDQWLQKALTLWKFTPAVVGTSPVSGELNLLFRFHSEASRSYRPPAHYRENMVFQVIDVFPPDSGETQWKIFVGRQEIASEAAGPRER